MPAKPTHVAMTFRYPSWLFLWSVAAGVATPVLAVITAEGLASASFGQRFLAGFLLVSVNSGYIAAPIMIGRSAVTSFLALVLLFLTALGWSALYISGAPLGPVGYGLAPLTALPVLLGGIWGVRHIVHLYRQLDRE